MSIEAYLSIKIPKWRLTICNTKTSIFISVLISIIFIAVDSYLISVNTLIESNSSSYNITKSYCYENTEISDLWFMVIFFCKLFYIFNQS